MGDLFCLRAICRGVGAVTNCFSLSVASPGKRDSSTNAASSWQSPVSRSVGIKFKVLLTSEFP